MRFFIASRGLNAYIDAPALSSSQIFFVASQTHMTEYHADISARCSVELSSDCNIIHRSFTLKVTTQKQKRKKTNFNLIKNYIIHQSNNITAKRIYSLHDQMPFFHFRFIIFERLLFLFVTIFTIF